MRRMLWAAMSALTLVAPARAQQDIGQGEIIVTGLRREADDYDEHVPAIGLRRLADYAVQPVRITGDTRDPERRHREIYEMLRGAIQLAVQKPGIQLAIGDVAVEPLTLANYSNLSLKAEHGREDADEGHFLVKVRLAPGTDARAALQRIDAFIKAVPPVGRAELQADGDLTLSVVKPDQYRDQIVALVAADARAIAARFGPEYAVEARNVDRPVEWTRASLTDVLLYVPYTLTVVPRGAQPAS